jgi:hypothetical protein
VIVSCPTCGAPVEFRFDDSMVRVCEHCKAAVARTDRGADTLGTFADLFPLASPLRLFAHGTFRGVGFQLVGVAQLRHGQGGLWQEWFAKLVRRQVGLAGRGAGPLLHDVRARARQRAAAAVDQPRPARGARR